MTNNDIFIYDLSELGLTLDDNQLDKFGLFFDSLVSENEKINLTSITDYHEVYKKHFIDSLSLISYGVDLSKELSIIDIGSGAGFPGIPLKIVFPDLHITLVDSTQKRVSFLDNVIKELNLSDIEAVHNRAEELAHNSCFREKFDICVSRAVANLSTLTEYCLPFVKTGGLFIAYKSENVVDEVDKAQNCISLLGGKLDNTMAFTLPNSDISRSFIGIKKVHETPAKSPRRAGLPSKGPL